MPLFTKLSKYTDFGLLIMRIGVGAMMMLHGFPKITGGTEKWLSLGKHISHVGINFGYTFWGFMAAISEGIGGLFIILGLFFRPTAFLLFFTMLIAVLTHLSSIEGDIWSDASHAIELCSVFIAMFIMGPGRFSVDKE
ncbi:MAG: DoxX family protein [Bacteroidetes bacterium]|nr:DoxX family protein [Bacteroidota bacterium]